MKQKRTYKGLINLDEFECLRYDNSILIENIAIDFDKNDKVFIRYYISDKEVSIDKLKSDLIFRVCGGNIDELEYELNAYSEYTIISLEQIFIVRGHDLVKELEKYIGKHLTLIIETL